jgi:Protein of unknown function (DUF983)
MACAGWLMYYFLCRLIPDFFSFETHIPNPTSEIIPSGISLSTTFTAMENNKPTPGYLWSVLTMKCPRCRRGPMFKDSNPFRKLKLSHIFDMPEHCPECGQRYDLEQGFWYGTGYVSYALAVALSVSTFIAWWVLIGVSTEDNRVFWWLGLNGLLLVLIQPWLMRLSRVIYLYFFVSYDPNYKQTKPIEFDHKQ